MNRKGQSVLEYAIILSVVVAGVVAMNIYMKRASEGHLRGSADRIGEQYSADNTIYTRVTNQPQGTKTTESFGGDLGQGVSRYEITNPQKTTTSMDGTGASQSEQINKKLEDEDLFVR
jgi:hypothetical protein